MVHAVTLAVILPPRSETEYRDGFRAGAHRIGTVVGVYPRRPIVGSGDDTLGYIHIDNVPDTISFEQLQRVLLRPGEIVADSETDTGGSPLERRYWSLDGATLPPPFRAALIADRVVTLPLRQVVDSMRSLKQGRPMVDADVENG